MAAAEPHSRSGSAGAYPHPRRAQQGAVAGGDEADPRPLRRGRRSKGRRVAGTKAASTRSPISRKPIRCRCFPMRSASSRKDASICCPMPAWCSTPSGRRTNCARPRSSAPRRIRPMSPSSASARTSRPAASGPASMPASIPGDITATEAPLLVRSLLSAGLDTTVNGIGAAIYCLARFPGPDGATAPRSVAGAQRVRGSGPVREPGADVLPHHHARGRDRRQHGSARARRS